MELLPKMEVRPVEPVDLAREPPPQAPVDYRVTVEEELERGGVVWVSGLASLVEQRYHVPKDAAKLRLRDALLKLLKAGEIQVQRCDDVESGETVSLYFAKSINENEGPLHRWMLSQAVEGCKGVVHVASSGEALPHIETGR